MTPHKEFRVFFSMMAQQNIKGLPSIERIPHQVEGLSKLKEEKNDAA